MTAGIILLVMVAVLIAAVFLLRLPTGLALALSAAAGALSGGQGLAIRHLVEGTMLYLDPILIVFTSLFFMAVFERSGALGALNTAIVSAFRRPAPLAMVLMIFVMFPGMFTGLTAPCVLTTGAMAAPVLMLAGVPRAAAGAFVAVAAFCGMVAPPVNIAAMIIGGGVDMPYAGFTWPLTIAVIPVAFAGAFLLGARYMRNMNVPQMLAAMPPSRYSEHGLRLFAPLLLLIVLMAGGRSFPQYVPYLGVPLMFVLCGLLGLFTGERVKSGEALSWAIRESLPVMSLLVGIGMFIQILTLTGARGFIVVQTLDMPSWLLLAAAAVMLPLFGGVSAYGASSVLGVPLLLALLGRNEIVVAAALSLLASVGDFLPPTRLAVLLSAQVVKEENPSRILKYCTIPAALAVLWGIAMILAANPLAGWLKIR